MWLRWRMVRSPGLRFTLCLAPVLVSWLVFAAAKSADSVTSAQLIAAVAVAPAAFLGFAFLAVVAPLTGSGGAELVPTDQLIAFPVRPRTVFLAGLALAPVNLVWIVQLIVLSGETAYLTVGGNGAAGALVLALFVVGLTISGQAIAWGVVGLRQRLYGRRAIALLGFSFAVAVVVVVRAGWSRRILSATPTHAVVDSILHGPGRLWLVTNVCLLAGIVSATFLGSRACAWSLRRASDAATFNTVTVRRRAQRRSIFWELVAVDRASAWRASALRRGALVLALLPGLVALGTGIPWQPVIILPGLVAAGAGLLFGVNMFCLDGSGAVWLASLPHAPNIAVRAKLFVLTETVSVSVVLAVLTGSLRSPGLPTATQLSAIVVASVACSALVIATCMSLSIRHPHRADLRSPRDAVAPPGALAAASARLAVPAALVGMILQVSSGTGLWWLPPLIGMPVFLIAIAWLHRNLQRWCDAETRALVNQAVSAG